MAVVLLTGPGAISLLSFFPQCSVKYVQGLFLKGNLLSGRTVKVRDLNQEKGILKWMFCWNPSCWGGRGSVLFSTVPKPDVVSLLGADWFNDLSGRKWERRSQLTWNPSWNEEASPQAGRHLVLKRKAMRSVFVCQCLMVWLILVSTLAPST